MLVLTGASFDFRDHPGRSPEIPDLHFGMLELGRVQFVKRIPKAAEIVV